MALYFIGRLANMKKIHFSAIISHILEVPDDTSEEKIMNEIIKKLENVDNIMVLEWEEI